MPIDVHAHYVPLDLITRLRTHGARLGISVDDVGPSCQRLHFAYGLEVRPFFAKLVEEPKSGKLGPRSKAGPVSPPPRGGPISPSPRGGPISPPPSG